MYETGFPNTNLKGKCAECKHYEPLVKTPWNRLGFDTKFCRGSCMIRPTEHGSFRYKQRTETCKKYEV